VGDELLTNAQHQFSLLCLDVNELQALSQLIARCAPNICTHVKSLAKSMGSKRGDEQIEPYVCVGAIVPSGKIDEDADIDRTCVS
jgi:hypothetical protein